MQAVTYDPDVIHTNSEVTMMGSRQEIQAVIETNNLSVFYGQKKAVDQVTLSFSKHSVTALIGPSGCGKSTFLRSLNRMNDEIEGCQVEGKIYYEGLELHTPQVSVFEVRKQIGMVFQRPQPFAKSIFQNVAYGPSRHGIRNKNKLEQIVEESLKKAALWDEVKDQLQKSALRLSGGQQQRLCIARALAMKPEVLLLDEPASALDPVSTAKIEALLTELKKEYTVIIVTHNMEQAARISDHVAFFYMGKVIEYGETKQMFGAPREQQTQQYIQGHIG